MKYLVFLTLALLAFLCAENVVINPGFDEDPWYKGWTVEGDSGAGAIGSLADTTLFLSPPQSCLIWASVGWTPSPYISIYQEFQPVRNCTCSVYFRNTCGAYSMGIPGCIIYLKINNEWREVWSCMFYDNPYWTRFHRFYDSTQVISGIKFMVYADCGCHGSWAWGDFWIDDVYVSGKPADISEETPQYPNSLEIVPNPFKNQLYLRIIKQANPQKPAEFIAKIFDPTGRLIKILQIDPSRGQMIWDGTDLFGYQLPAGVYIIKLEEKNAKGFIGIQKVVKY